MIYVIIYFVVLLLAIAIINRYCKDHPEHCYDNHDEDLLSNKEVFIMTAVIWPISILIGIIAAILYSIYKIIYYVVDKIYSKFISKRVKIN